MEIKRYGEKEFLSADKLYIRENEIHIWCIRWPEMTDFWKNHEYILSGQELEQAGRFRFPEDRMRYSREGCRADPLKKILRYGND